MRTVQFTRFAYSQQLLSTNEYAMNLSNKDPKHNLCLYTYDQTAGRGQIGRKWYSGVGENLSCTFIWQDVSLSAKAQFQINMAFALTIYQLIDSKLGSLSMQSSQSPSPVTIKWPNDIYVGDQKIAGLLIQNVLKGENISTCLLGVGINVNTLSFPSDLSNPISLSQLLGRDQDLLSLQLQLADLLGLFLSNSFAYPARQRALYEELLYRQGVVSGFVEDGKKFSGEILGVTEAGKLRVLVAGEERWFNFRELGYVL